jgi:hypothetical protein
MGGAQSRIEFDGKDKNLTLSGTYAPLTFAKVKKRKKLYEVAHSCDKCEHTAALRNHGRMPRNAGMNPSTTPYNSNSSLWQFVTKSKSTKLNIT